MTTPVIPAARSLYEEQRLDIERFETAIEQYLNGEIPEDVFRVMRLNNGIYGQRQGGTNQMVRIKLPAGTITPEQFDLMGRLATEFSRGWGHITTRQNIQFHFVELTRIPALLRELAAVGLTSREACGDTVRNVMACHLAGACPHEKLDVTPWAEATFRHFVRNPIGQRLPRKFKVNFSGCSTDCGQAMFNDVGVVAVSRTNDDGSIEVVSAATDFAAVKAGLEKAGLKPEIAEITYKPVNETPLAPDDAAKLRHLIDVRSANERGSSINWSPNFRAASGPSMTVQGITSFCALTPDHSTKQIAMRR